MTCPTYRKHQKTTISLLIFTLLFLSFLQFNFTPTTKAEYPTTGTKIFEYGGEESTIVPPFSYWTTNFIYCHHDKVTSSIHGGNNSIRLWMEWEATIDHSNAASIVYKMSDSVTEFYVSYWIYIPSGQNDVGTWGIAASKYWERWNDGPSGSGNLQGDILYHDLNPENQITWGGHFRHVEGTTIVDTPIPAGAWTEANSGWVDQWKRVQFYIKRHPTAGNITWWIGDTWKYTYTGRTSYRDQRTVNSVVIDMKVYFGKGGTHDVLYYFDDFVIATDYVDSDYVVGGASEDVDWFNGFEEGDFSAWSSTEQANGGIAPTITSSTVYYGSYSGNFSTDGSDTSYSRAIKLFQPRTEMYIRSYVRFNALPDSANDKIFCNRFANATNDYIVTVGLHQHSSNSSIGWNLLTPWNQATNYTNTPTIDTWYLLDLRIKSTSNGVATLWINSELKANITGDFSDRGSITRANAHIYVEGNQPTSVYVLHDLFAISDEGPIGPYAPHTGFQIIEFYGGEVGGEPIPNVTVNGTSTDASGFCEIGQLNYDATYVFVVSIPSGYFPAWVLNVEGSYVYSGSTYVLTHTIYEGATGYIQIFLFDESLPFIQETNAKITSCNYVESNSGDSLIFVVSGSGTTNTKVNVVDLLEPRSISFTGSTLSTSSYNRDTRLVSLNVVHLSDVLVTMAFYSDTAYEVYFFEGCILGFQNEYGSEVDLTIKSGNLYSRTSSVALTSKGGYFTFTSEEDHTTTISYFGRVKVVTVNGVTVGNVSDYLFKEDIYYNVVWVLADVGQATVINAYIGLVGIALFCINPVLSYKLSDDARDKFKFLMFLMAIGIIAVGLMFTFIYSGL